MISHGVLNHKKEIPIPTKAINVLFGITIGLSAFLLFQVQPIISKYILPWYGGSPSVWTTCLLFFQLVLLFGYLYAHLLTGWLQPQKQVIIHVLLLLASLFFLPVTPSAFWKPETNSDPSLTILLMLTACLGLPYFILSTTSPLLQRWLSIISPGAIPYRLYALSNICSLVALVSYPFLFEPNLSRYDQALVWSFGLVLFVIVCSLCGKYLWNAKKHEEISSRQQVEDTNPVNGTSYRLFYWIALPATASIALLATTNKLCQEIAVIPFLWILPLTLYLISFIICFDKPKWYSRPVFAIGLAISLIILCSILLRDSEPTPGFLIIAFAPTLFFICMICHGEVTRLKPAPQKLTLYYLCISFGSVLGSVFVVIISPFLFTDYSEYYLSIFLTLGLTLTIWYSDPKNKLYKGKPVGAWIGFAAGILLLSGIIIEIRNKSQEFVVLRTRNFYGTLTIAEYRSESPAYKHRTMRHGNILHGMQYMGEQFQTIPTTYYTQRSGVGLCLEYFSQKESIRVGVVGLGAGTLATWGRPGDYFRFYEINPDVISLAESYFTYMKNCWASNDMVLGDARLSLEREQSQQFDILILDAFNNDSPPLHLLTKESFKTYLRHLKPGGALAFNVTSKYLNFYPVLFKQAEYYGMNARYLVDSNPENDETRSVSWWIIISSNLNLLNHPVIMKASSTNNESMQPPPLWTDDYTSLFPIMKW